MAVWRIAAIGVILSLALGSGIGAQEFRDTVGPLEKEAKPITPENPVPRRVFSAAPLYPAEAQAIDAAARVNLRITLDRGGRIAEIRSTSNPLVMPPPGAAADPAVLRTIADALIRSAVAAVQQWQYDAPADGPISLNLQFDFRPGAEVTFSQNAAPVPPTAPTALVAQVPSTWAAARGAVRVGGNVRAPAQLRRVNPTYPAEAKEARVQGVVILEAVIGADGRVVDARVLRSIPLLDQAALDAVRQWEYTPTLLNGAPVPLVMTVTVQFTLT